MKIFGILLSKSQAILAVGTIVFISGGLLLMNKVADIRVRELSNSLKNMSPDRTAGSSLSLIARFILLRDRAAGKAEDKNAILAESEILTITSAGFVDLSREKRITLDEQALILLLNVFDKVLGGNSAIDLSEDQRGRILEVAFLHERRRNYGQAIRAYNAALFNYDGTPDIAAYIYLHRGFCYALDGDRKRALKDLARAKKFDPQGELGRTAAILAGFLVELESQRLQVEGMADSLDKVQFYLRLAAYQKALDVLKKLPPQGGRYFYLRGRAHEEIGKSDNAISDYRRTIAINKDTEWARLANRRLYLLVSFYNPDEKVLKEAEKNAAAMKDDELIENVTVMRESLSKEDVEQSTAAEAIEIINENIQETNEEREDVIKEKVAAAKQKIAEAKAAETGEDPDDIDVEPTAEELAAIEESAAEEVGAVEPAVVPAAKKAPAVPTVASIAPKKKTTWTKNLETAKPAKSIEADIKELKKKNQQAYARNQLRNPKTPRVVRKQLLTKHFPQLDKIRMIDGNTFYGIIASRKNGVSEVLTVAGVVRIPDELVTESSTVPSNKEYQDYNPGSGSALSYAKVPLKLKIKLLDKKNSRNKRKQLMLDNFDTLDRIITIDGNSYTGLVFAKDGAKTHMITVIGKISIPNNVVKEKKEIDSSVAFNPQPEEAIP